MRTGITRDAMVSSDMANRFYDENVTPILAELKSDEAKEMFAETILIKASASLYHLVGNDFEQRMVQVNEAIKHGVDANSQAESAK